MKDDFSFKTLGSFLSNLSPLEFSTIGCLLGIFISEQTTSNEQNAIGNFLELVGQVILTYQAQGVLKGQQSVTINEFNDFKNYILNILKKWSF